MNKKDLAESLRSRQINIAHLKREVVASLTDDEIIESYTTCAHCGEKEVLLDEAVDFAEKCKDVDDWFEMLNGVARARELAKRGQELLDKERRRKRIIKHW